MAKKGKGPEEGNAEHRDCGFKGFEGGGGKKGAGDKDWTNLWRGAPAQVRPEDEITPEMIAGASRLDVEEYIRRLRNMLPSLGTAGLPVLVAGRDAAMGALVAALEGDDAVLLTGRMREGTSEEVMAVLGGLSAKGGEIGKLAASAEAAKKAADDVEGPIKRVRELIALCRKQVPIAGAAAPAKGGGNRRGARGGDSRRIDKCGSDLAAGVNGDTDEHSTRERERGVRDELFQRGIGTGVEED